MSTPERPTEPAVEQDSRFPSGPWKGFFLQPDLPGRQWMELILEFRAGVVRGEGRDRVGAFLVRGRYSLDDGKCYWTKRYLGRHDIAYNGYNEGKGIWGLWQDPYASYWRGGFHIWPEAMGDPTAPRLSEAVEEPVLISVGAEEEVEAGVETVALPY
jgi:hypothetical protein